MISQKGSAKIVCSMANSISSIDKRTKKVSPIINFLFLLISALQVCTVRKKDIRKFLDGVYVSNKGTVTEKEDTD